MSISDEVGEDLDADADGLWSLINANDEAQTISIDALVGEEVVLHPVQVGSSDPIVRTAAFDASTGTFTVPGRTTAVFVDLEGDTTAPEVEAKLAPISTNRKSGLFRVWYSCTDDRDPNPVSVATLNGVPVEKGTRVVLATTRTYENHTWIHGKLFMWAPAFELRVECSDAAGNVGVATAEPRFRRFHHPH